jgi:hypothetical protein
MKKIISMLLASVLILSLPALALAQGGSSNSGSGGSSNTSTQGGSSNKGGITNPLKGNADLSALMKNLLRLAFMLGTIIVVFFIILAGFKYVTAGGNPKKIEEAHAMLLWTVVGAIILLGAQTIADVIFNTVKQLGA